MKSAIDYIKPGERVLCNRLETDKEEDDIKAYKAHIRMIAGPVFQEIEQEFVAANDAAASKAAEDWRFEVTIERIPNWYPEGQGTVKRYKLVPCDDEETE